MGVFNLIDDLPSMNNFNNIGDMENWFDDLLSRMRLNFIICGEVNNFTISNLIVSGFSQKTLQDCITHNAILSDPIISNVISSPKSLSMFLESGVHPRYGQRLSISIDHKTLLLFSFGHQIPEDNTIKYLYFLSPHIHHSINQFKKKNTDISVDLTNREKEVLQWVKCGKGNWEISNIMNISERTVRFHLTNIYSKLDVNNRTHAISKAIDFKIL